MSYQEIYRRKKTGFIAWLLSPSFETDIASAPEQYKEGLAKHGAWTSFVSSRQSPHYFEFGLEEKENYGAFWVEKAGTRGPFKRFESEILHKGKDKAVPVKLWFVQFPEGKPIVLRMEADVDSSV